MFVAYDIKEADPCWPAIPVNPPYEFKVTPDAAVNPTLPAAFNLMTVVL